MSVVETASPAAIPEPGPWRIGWIVSPPTDLLFFIGGALGGYALFFMHAGLQWNMYTVWLLWYVLLDAPHFFGTYSRTYLDREEMRRRRPLLLGSLLWLVAGPALLGISFLLHSSPSLARYHGLPFALFVAFFGLWAYWHVVRQHYGILALYKRKNQDIAPVDQWVDKTLLYVGLLAPLAAFIVRHPETRGELALLGLLPNFDVPGSWSWGNGIVIGSVLAVGLAAAAFLGRQAWRWSTGASVNVPKVLFLVAVVPLHALICYHPAVLATSLLSFSAFVTIFHDIQYHAIVWHYQRNRCHRPGVDPRRFGLAAVVSRWFPLYAACGLATGIAGWYISCSLGASLGCTPLLKVHPSQVTLFGEVTLQSLFFSVVVGVSLHHYFVDQYIWRPSKDAELRRNLNVVGAA